MGEPSGSRVRRKQLGRELRRFREKARMSLDEAAPKLDISTSTLSRIENALGRVDVHLVRSMLDLYGIGGDRWAEIVELTREARRRGWWRAFGVDDQGYVPLESDANLIRDFTLAHVPGLLQTEAYARAMFHAGLHSWSEDRLENEIKVRMIRQARLISEENPLELIAVVDESALHRSVGGLNVMRAQLNYLAEAAALSTVTLQVLPAGADVDPTLLGQFTLLSFEDLGEPDMAYVEHPLGAVHVEKETEVERAKLVFNHLRSKALSPADSIALIKEVAAQLDSP